MARHRYQPPSTEPNPDAEQLPTDTVCTILTRQSTPQQAERHINSEEVNPEKLVAVARRLGFAPERIEVVGDDMGIGA